MQTIEVSPKPPFSLARTVGAFARFPEECVDRVQSSRFRRAFDTGGGIALIEATQTSSDDLTAPVRVSVLRATGQPDFEAALRQVQEQLAAHESIDALYSVMQRHTVLAFLASELQGLRRTLDPSPFEGLVSSILAQLISTRGAAIVRARFVRRYGTSIEHDGDDYWTFPNPSDVQHATIDELCSLGMTGTKARAIQTVAARSANGELDIGELRELTDGEVIDRLVALPGIGPWTSEWFLVNVLGRMSVVPSGDLGIRRATGKWLLHGEMPSPADVRRTYEPFGDLRGYIAYYILSAERYRLSPPAP